MLKKIWLAGLTIVAMVLIAALSANIYLGRDYFISGASRVIPTPLPELSEEGERLHKSLWVVDLHNDLLLAGRDATEWGAAGHSDIPRLQAGNVGLQVLSAVIKVPFGLNPRHNDDKSDMVLPLAIWQHWPVRTWFDLTERALYQADKLKKIANSDAVHLITTKKQLEKRKPLGVILAIEGLHALEGDEKNYQRLYDAGYRMMGLAHFFDNKVSGSAHGVNKGPLTDFGRHIVKRMEDDGVVIDLAHTSPSAIKEVLAMVSRPVVVSHTGVKGTCPSMRNLSDEQIASIAAGGGVIGIGFWTTALCDITPDGIVKAIRYVSDLVGVEYVALGTDYDGATKVGFSADKLALITDALLRANFSEHEIRLIMGENTQRVLGQILH